MAARPALAPSPTATATCKKSRERCLEILVENQRRSLETCASLLGQVGSTGTSESHKETIEVFFGAVFVMNALELAFANKGLQMAVFNADAWREGGGQGCSVCKEGDTLDNLQKFLDLMECVFAVTKNGHVFLTVEEGVAYGTVAYTVAFQFGHACDRVLVAGCACCHDANFSVVFRGIRLRDL